MEYKYIIIIILIIILFIVYFKFLKKTNESFVDLESMQEKDILPDYINITPKQLVDYFGGIDELTQVLVANNIPIEYLNDPKQYPKIASYLKMKSNT